MRSPFHSILGFSELLLEHGTDFEVAESEKYMGLIHSTAKNTLVLLDNLLKWAKTQTGTIMLHPEKIFVSSLIQEILEISNAAAKIKNITLNHHQTDEIEVCVDKDVLKTFYEI